MSKVKTLLDVVEDIRSLAEHLKLVAEDVCSLAESIKVVAEVISSNEQPKIAAQTIKKSPPPAAPEKVVTLEQVRAVLAEKSHDGLTAEVRALLEKYGAQKLSAIDPKDYAALLKDAEVLGHDTK